MESIFDGETQGKVGILWLCCRGRRQHFSGFESGSGNGSRGTIPIEKMAKSAVWSQNVDFEPPGRIFGILWNELQLPSQLPSQLPIQLLLQLQDLR